MHQQANFYGTNFKGTPTFSPTGDLYAFYEPAMGDTVRQAGRGRRRVRRRLLQPARGRRRSSTTCPPRTGRTTSRKASRLAYLGQQGPAAGQRQGPDQQAVGHDPPGPEGRLPLRRLRPDAGRRWLWCRVEAADRLDHRSGRRDDPVGHRRHLARQLTACRYAGQLRQASVGVRQQADLVDKTRVRSLRCGAVSPLRPTEGRSKHSMTDQQVLSAPPGRRARQRARKPMGWLTPVVWACGRRGHRRDHLRARARNRRWRDPLQLAEPARLVRRHDLPARRRSEQKLLVMICRDPAVRGGDGRDPVADRSAAGAQRRAGRGLPRAGRHRAGRWPAVLRRSRPS